MRNTVMFPLFEVQVTAYKTYTRTKEVQSIEGGTRGRSLTAITAPRCFRVFLPRIFFLD
jgi:hypothetical protein